MFGMIEAEIDSLLSRFADDKRVGIDGYLVDFLGARYDISFFPSSARGRSGTLEEMPHRQGGQFANSLELPQVLGLIKSIQRSGPNYSMLSLGAGFGEWALKARMAWIRAGKSGVFYACCVEADVGHANMIHENVKANNLADAEIDVRLAAIATIDGVARFPKLFKPSEDWGAGVVSVATSENELDDHMVDVDPAFFAHRKSAAGGELFEWTTVPARGLSSLLDEIGIVDYIHSDLQNFEGTVFPESITAVTEKVRMVSIETHSIEADARLVDAFTSHGWISEFRRPFNGGPDGTMVWFNPRLS